MDTGKIMQMDEQLEKVPGGTVLPYVVQPGDSLRMIANKYHVSIEQLMKWNNMQNPDIIRIGQTIKKSCRWYGYNHTIALEINPLLNTL